MERREAVLRVFRVWRDATIERLSQTVDVAVVGGRVYGRITGGHNLPLSGPRRVLYAKALSDEPAGVVLRPARRACKPVFDTEPVQVYIP